MDAVKLLLERASAVKLRGPGPSQHELETILRSALRAPDHGRLRPWRFIVISGADREQFGTPAMPPRASARPELGDFVTRWPG
jgi:nitroreductase